jgi:GNAT superfamily N-acetyltransferase
MSHPLDTPIWSALTTEHAHLAIASPGQSPRALRYPADVLPMAAIKEETSSAIAELRELLAPPTASLPGESIYLTAESLPACDGLDILDRLPCLQMTFPPGAAIPSHPASNPPIVPLSPSDASDMFAFTRVAFPGLFRLRTYVLGSYYGIHSGPAHPCDTALIAMSGERLVLPGMRELSAVCTHPRYLGQGLAARLITHVLSRHAAAGQETFLHVTATNQRAIDLYHRLGFITRRAITLHQVRRA